MHSKQVIDYLDQIFHFNTLIFVKGSKNYNKNGYAS